MKDKKSKAPKAYQEFITRYPELGEAWQLMSRAGKGCEELELKTQLLMKLGIAVGAQRPGSVSSAVRKALDAGVSVNEIEQVVALAASTIGLPASVASYGWISEAIRKYEEQTGN